MADEARAKRTHENELSVITVGSGIPSVDQPRVETMTMIQYNGRYIILDCGYMTVYRLFRENFDLSKIDMIMFTHFHADHSTDFFNLMIWRYLNGGRKLDIIGPPRTKDYYSFWKNFFKDDTLYRAQVYNINTSSGSLKEVNVHELKGSKKIDINGITIENTEMVHTMYDLAYKFTFNNNKTIVVSGDTSYTGNLIKLAKGTDILVLDGSWIIFAEREENVKNGSHSKSQKPGQRKIDGSVPKPMKYAGNFDVESHFNYNDNIKIVGEIKPKKLIFSHQFSSFMSNSDPLTKEVKDRIENDLKAAGYDGEVFYATDGMEVSI